MAKKKSRKVTDMAPEYHFDYSKAKPNRFASRAKDTPLVVVIDNDVVETKPVNAKKQKEKK